MLTAKRVQTNMGKLFALISRHMFLTDTCVSFKHYFKDDELDTFKSAMSTIQENNDPTNAPYNFIINCDPTGDVAEKCDEDEGS